MRTADFELAHIRIVRFYMLCGMRRHYRVGTSAHPTMRCCYGRKSLPGRITKTKRAPIWEPFFYYWRRGWDSNPRYDLTYA